MTYEEIELMFRDKDNKYIMSLSKKELQNIYIDLYGIEPNKYWSKKELIYQINDYISSTRRTMDLAKNIRW